MTDHDATAVRERPAGTPAERPGGLFRRRGGPAPDQPRARWRWGTRLVVTACVAWLAFVVLHLALSGRTYWWAPFDLAPPLVFAAVPVLLLALVPLARPVRRWLAAVPVLALLLGAGCSGINPATLWYTPPPAGPGAITMVSWNTMYWDQDLRSGGRLTTADFYRFLRGMDVDVYLLHEYAHLDDSQPDLFAKARVIDQLALLRENFPGYQIVIVGRDVTLSRLPVVSSKGIDSTPWIPADLREVPPAQRDHPEYYLVHSLRTDIRLGDRVVSFYNTHMEQPPSQMIQFNDGAVAMDRFNFDKRNASYRAIRADIADNPNPVVLAGDLNTSVVMGARRLWSDRLVDNTRALSSLYPVTWQDGGVPLWRIDWLLTSREMAVHRYDLLGSAGLSDHKVQRVVLSVGNG